MSTNYPYDPYFPAGMGKNEEGRWLIEQQENGRWSDHKMTVKVRGRIVTWIPKGGMKNVRVA